MKCEHCLYGFNGINGWHCSNSKVRRSVNQDGRNAVPACERQ